MKNSNIIGWLLLTTGLTIIILTLVYSYNIFTAKNEVPAFFEIENQKDLSVIELTEEPVFQFDPQVEIEKMMENQISEMIPRDTIPKMLNLTIWSMLAFILIFGGSHIANLGIKLIKSNQKITE